jgi:RNA polymerase sigma-54 factor
MPKPALVSLQQKIKQTQWMIMTQQMQQAIHLLQVPVMELSSILTEHLEQNPIVESDIERDELDDIDEEDEDEESDHDLLEKSLAIREDDFEILRRLDDDFHSTFEDEIFQGSSAHEKDYQTYTEQSIRSQPTLFEHLMKQANEAFAAKTEQEMAEAIIGNFNENGYLDISLQEIALLNNFPLEKLREILQKIQTFDPYGIGSSTLQESLLNQLRLQGKEHSLAARIVKDHYDDLLHNRIPLIQKKLDCSSKEIAHAISHDLLRLDIHPGMIFSRNPVQVLVPDVTIQQDGEELRVLVNHDFLPPLRINARYRKMMGDPDVPRETKDFIRKKILSFKWLCRNIQQRGSTLERIAASLAKRQLAFFLDPEGTLVPLTMKEIAEELELNESTIARAVSNKYLNSPRGLHPLRFFFSNAYVNEDGGEVSATTVRNVLKSMIQKEDKRHPLSDETLSLCLRDHGIACARRTISKYRAELNLGNALQRKKF